MAASYNPEKDMDDFTRRMGARYMFRDADEKRSSSSSSYNPRLRLASSWQVPQHLLNPNLYIYLKETRASLLHHAKSIAPAPIHNMSRKHVAALRELKRRKDIRVIIADKNQGICIVSPSQYKDLVELHLLNTDFYRQVTTDDYARHLTMVTMTLGQIASALKKHDERGAKFIVERIPITSSRLPNFYVLAKVHKMKAATDPIPTRPIVASHSYITTPASIYLDSRLQPFLHHLPTVLKDTKSFVQTIEGNTFPAECVLVTADVEALYTNMPTAEVLSSLRDFLRTQNVKDASLLVRIAEVILRNNLFRFGRRTYLQLQGTAMGTPAAVSLANLFMSLCYDHRLINRLGDETVLLYRRLIDDIFMIVRQPIPDNLREIMCSINRSITVTPEISEERVNFLDLNIYKGGRFRSTGILDLCTHTKKTALFLYPPFASFHPAHNKTALIMTELIRFIRNCSSIESFWSERDNFFHNLRSRGYPARLILRVFRLPNVQYSRRAELLASLPSVRSKSKALVYTCMYTKHTRAIPMTRLLREHWHLIADDPELAAVFPSAPITGWRVGQKLRNLLTRSAFIDDDDEKHA